MPRLVPRPRKITRMRTGRILRWRMCRSRSILWMGSAARMTWTRTVTEAIAVCAKTLRALLDVVSSNQEPERRAKNAVLNGVEDL